MAKIRSNPAVLFLLRRTEKLKKKMNERRLDDGMTCSWWVMGYFNNYGVSKPQDQYMSRAINSIY